MSKNRGKTRGVRWRRARLPFVKAHLGFDDCVIPGCRDPITLHHIVPRGKGGSGKSENLLPICHKHHAMLHGMKVHEAPPRPPEMPQCQVRKKTNQCPGNGTTMIEGRWHCLRCARLHEQATAHQIR